MRPAPESIATGAIGLAATGEMGRAVDDVAFPPGTVGDIGAGRTISDTVGSTGVTPATGAGDTGVVAGVKLSKTGEYSGAILFSI